MATVSLLSGQITNRDATPRVATNGNISRGQVFGSMGKVGTSALDDIGSKYKFCSIPSNARMVSLLLSNSSVGTAGTADIGLYATTANGGTVIDADFFASAVSLVTAQSNVDVLTEANGANASMGKDDLELMVWQALGLTSDPKVDYDIVATLTAATVGTASVAVQALYQV